MLFQMLMLYGVQGDGKMIMNNDIIRICLNWLRSRCTPGQIKENHDKLGQNKWNPQ